MEIIFGSLTKIFAISKGKKIPTYVAANRLAEERIARVAKSRRQFLRNEKNILSQLTNNNFSK